MPNRLDVKVFGPFGVSRSDGSAVAPLGRKAQGLLAYLAVENGATRDRAASLFWGELREERARHNLRQALSKIRSDCGSIIESAGESLRLDSTRCVVDVSEFLRLARQDDPQSLEDCLSLYSGELLAGLVPREPDFEDWLRLTRDRLRNLACEVMDRYVRHLIEAEQYERAIIALNRRLEIDPACETAHRDLMIVFARLGRRSDALRQYELCTAALRREHGVAPSADLVGLLDSLRRPGLAATAQPLPTAGFQGGLRIRPASRRRAAV